MQEREVLLKQYQKDVLNFMVSKNGYRATAGKALEKHDYQEKFWNQIPNPMHVQDDEWVEEQTHSYCLFNN